MRPLLLCLCALLFALSPPPSIDSQALQDRTHPDQRALVRAAVLDGRLPPASTWPQPSPAPSEGVTSASEVALFLGGAVRLAGDTLWDQYLFRPGYEDALVQWTVHSEETGRWGFLLHADYYDSTPGWHSTTLILPNAQSPFPLESHFLTRAWLWYDFQPLQIEIGRDRVHWGALDHSLLISDAVPFLDLVRGSLTGGPWSLNWIIATPETRTEGGGSLVSTFQLLNFHRLEYRTATWAWAISERYIVSRPNGPFVIADIMPVAVAHQFDINPNNNCLYFDAEWVPAPGFRLMGQYGLDDIDAASLGWKDNPIPTSWAVLLGAEWQGQAEGDLRLYGEMGLTHYLWGNFGDAAARAQYLAVLDLRTESMPLSAPYGPGTAWLNVSTRWSQGPLSLSFLLEIFTTMDGVTTDLTNEYHPEFEGIGTDLSERLTFDARWQLDPNWAVTLQPEQNFYRGALGLEAKATLEWKP